MKNMEKYRPKFGSADLKIFTPAFIMKNFGVTPIVFLCTYACCVMAFCTIDGFLRTDVVLTRQSLTQGEMTDLIIHPVNRKFFHFGQVYKPNPDLYEAYKEVCKAQKKREADCKKQARENQKKATSSEE